MKKTIGFIQTYQIGDNILAFPALYALKHIYQCRLIVFGNALMCNMLRYCDFVDECVDIGFLDDNSIARIDGYKCDAIILPNARKRFIALLQASNAKVIITAIKFPSLFAKKVSHPPLYSFFAYRKMQEWQRHLLLARCVDSVMFDKSIASLDFSRARIKIGQKHRDFATALVPNAAAGGGGITYSSILLATLADIHSHSKGGLNL